MCRNLRHGCRIGNPWVDVRKCADTVCAVALAAHFLLAPSGWLNSINGERECAWRRVRENKCHAGLFPLLFCQLIKPFCIATLCSVVKLGEILTATVAFCGQAAALPAGRAGGFVVQSLCVITFGGKARTSKHEPIKIDSAVGEAEARISFDCLSRAVPVRSLLRHFALRLGSCFLHSRRIDQRVIYLHYCPHCPMGRPGPHVTRKLSR